MDQKKYFTPKNTPDNCFTYKIRFTTSFSKQRDIMVAHGKQTDAEFNKEPVRENLANGHPDSPVPYETYDCSGNRR